MDLIVIPSRGRAKRQKTLSCFEETGISQSYKVVLAVPESELRAYRHSSFKGKPFKASTWQRVDLVGVPEKYSGISRTREYIFNVLTEKYDARKLFMVDDDLMFCHRPDLNNASMPYIDHDDFQMFNMVETLSGWLDEGLVHVGLKARQENRKLGIDYVEPGRLMNLYAFDTKVICRLMRQGKLQLGRVPVMEDFDLTLQLLRLGYPSRVSCQFAWTQFSNTSGGCSLYRTSEVQAAAARKLAKLHPPFVKVMERKAKTWKGLTERLDVRISWQKAYKEGLQVRKRKGVRNEKSVAATVE